MILVCGAADTTVAKACLPTNTAIGKHVCFCAAPYYDIHAVKKAPVTTTLAGAIVGCAPRTWPHERQGAYIIDIVPNSDVQEERYMCFGRIFGD
jgi:hypothetical protein